MVDKGVMLIVDHASRVPLLLTTINDRRILEPNLLRRNESLVSHIEMHQQSVS